MRLVSQRAGCLRPAEQLVDSFLTRNKMTHFFPS